MEKGKEEVKEQKAETGTDSFGPTLTDRVRENPWVIATFVLGIVTLILLINNFTGSSITGGAVGVASEDDVTAKVNTFLELQTAGAATLESISLKDGFYEALVSYQGAQIPLYVTADGKNLAQLTSLDEIIGASETDTNQQVQEVTPSTKPSVELYVFTYCPYGLQMEKAIDPVLDLLGNKIDFKIRQIGAMHGDYEAVEAKRQLCIEKEYPAKYLDYVNAFALDTTIGTCNGDATCVLPKINAIYTKLGISGAKIDSCMSSTGETLYSAEEANSQAKGVSGSPTLLINGVNVQVTRSPDAIKTAICNAFTTAPGECSQALSTSAASAGFGAGTGSATAAQC